MANIHLKLIISKLELVIFPNTLPQICPFPHLPYLNKHHFILLLRKGKNLSVVLDSLLSPVPHIQSISKFCQCFPLIPPTLV